MVRGAGSRLMVGRGRKHPHVGRGKNLPMMREGQKTAYDERGRKLPLMGRGRNLPMVGGARSGPWWEGQEASHGERGRYPIASAKNLLLLKKLGIGAPGYAPTHQHNLHLQPRFCKPHR